MTELQLLCSPFRVAEASIRNCLEEPIAEDLSEKLARITTVNEKIFLNVLKSISEENGLKEGEIGYQFLLPIFFTAFSHEGYYGDIVKILPSHIVDRLELFSFPDSAPAVDWQKTINRFLYLRDVAAKRIPLGDLTDQRTDQYISVFFTKAILHFTRDNLAYDKEEFNKYALELFECQENDRLIYSQMQDDYMVKSGNIALAVALRHEMQDLLRSIKTNGKTPLLPEWVQNRSEESIITEAEKHIRNLSEIESEIEEKIKYNLYSFSDKKNGRNKATYSRGEYDTKTKQAISSFENKLKEFIELEIKAGREVDRKKIIKKARKYIISTWNIPYNTFRSELSAQKQEELFDEFHQKLSEGIRLNNR